MCAMIKDNLKISGLSAVISAFLVIGVVCPGLAFCQDNGIVLLIQQSPAQGGSVTPEEGVHKFGTGEEVVLTAVPKPGYQFVYWIGDVSDSTANRTSVYLNAPKIVIAVFERSEFDFLVADELPQSRPGGGLTPSAPDYANTAYSGGGAKRPSKPGVPSIPPETPEEPADDFPAQPEGEVNDDFPVPEPIPEPATISLMILGCLGLVRKRRALQTMRL